MGPNDLKNLIVKFSEVKVKGFYSFSLIKGQVIVIFKQDCWALKLPIG
jgi:hypothetical protein